MNVGFSDQHSSSVNQVLSLDTGHVSPQCHVVCDELFTAVAGDTTDRVFDAEEWNSLFLLDAKENLHDPRDVRHGTEPFPALFDDFVSASEQGQITTTQPSILLPPQWNLTTTTTMTPGKLKQSSVIVFDVENQNYWWTGRVTALQRGNP
jgi:hypothetical protein